MGKRIAIAIVVTLVAVELTLQAAGLLAPIFSSRGSERKLDTEITILCVGDSHTYGAPLPEKESYPSQLQRSLRTRYGDGVDVVNLGVPGANSAMVANRLEVQIARFRPDLVIAWVGVNSFWNPTETEVWDDESWSWRSHAFHSKLVRLAAITWYNLTAPEFARPKLKESTEERTVFQYGSETLVVSEHKPSGSLEEKRRGIELDLIRMVDIARRYETPIVFVTYPYNEIPTIRTVNAAIRSVAYIHDVEVVESGRSLERALKDGFSNEELVVNAAGPHPRETLYRYIVESMLPVVNRLVWEKDDLGEEVSARR